MKVGCEGHTAPPPGSAEGSHCGRPRICCTDPRGLAPRDATSVDQTRMLLQTPQFLCEE